MKNPKFHEKWFVDLSPTTGYELGGVRQCLVEEIINKDLIRVVPYAVNFESETGYDYEPMYEHIRTVDISRFRSRCI
jgi:hypothetical protein